MTVFSLSVFTSLSFRRYRSPFRHVLALPMSGDASLPGTPILTKSSNRMERRTTLVCVQVTQEFWVLVWWRIPGGKAKMLVKRPLWDRLTQARKKIADELASGRSALGKHLFQPVVISSIFRRSLSSHTELKCSNVVLFSHLNIQKASVCIRKRNFLISARRQKIRPATKPRTKNVYP